MTFENFWPACCTSTPETQNKMPESNNNYWYILYAHINIWIIQILIIIINIRIIQIIIIILMSCRPCMLQVTLLGLYNNNYYKNYSYNSTLMIFTFLWYSSFSFATAQVALKTAKIINIELFQSTVHIPLHNFYVLITSHNNFYVLNLSLVNCLLFSLNVPCKSIVDHHNLNVFTWSTAVNI